jgi:hypothetical protein
VVVGTNEIRRYEEPDGSVLYVHRRGALQLYDLGSGVALHVCGGISLPEFAPLVMADGDRLIGQYGRAVFFVDSYDASAMTTEFREAMTAWVRDKVDVATSHILIRSPLWSMALSVAALVVGRRALHVYSSIDQWERAGRSEVADFRRRPLVMSEVLGRSA